MNDSYLINNIKNCLTIINEFVDSDTYLLLNNIKSHDTAAREWLDQFNITKESFDFFFEINPLHVRSLLEVNNMVNMINKLTW